MNMANECLTKRRKTSRKWSF